MTDYRLTRSMRKAMVFFLLMREFEAGAMLTAPDVVTKYGVSMRTAHRILNELSAVMPLVADEGQRPWVWTLMEEMRR